MKIVSTAGLLVLTLLAVPIMSYFFGSALGEREWQVLYTLFGLVGVVMVLTFLLGEFSKNYSQVDKLWSILPIAYVWIVAHHGDYTPRLVLMAVLVSFWGIRLTANFALKGAYQWKFWEGEEDYRWKILREKPEFQPPWKFTLFNLFFICGYQNVLILLFTLPTVVALQYNEVPLGPVDYVAAVAMGFFILFETLADRQQWIFQQSKKAKQNRGDPREADTSKGFLDRGLWSLSRHPNYFAEQSIWICFYLFGAGCSGQWFNWSILGAVLLLVLFKASSNFSEEISAGKYPEYKNYQATVPRFWPLGKYRN